MKKVIFLLVLLAAAAGAYVYYWAPRATLSQVRDAWLDRDAVTLGELVDFAALRTQIKTSVLTELNDSKEKDGSIFGTLLTGIASGVIDAGINKFVTPEWLVVATLPDPARDAARYQERYQKLEAQLNSYVDSAQFHLKSHDEIHCDIVDDDDQHTLIFKREGLSWRVRGFSSSLVERIAKESAEQQT